MFFLDRTAPRRRRLHGNAFSRRNFILRLRSEEPQRASVELEPLQLRPTRVGGDALDLAAVRVQSTVRGKQARADLKAKGLTPGREPAGTAAPLNGLEPTVLQEIPPVSVSEAGKLPDILEGLQARYSLRSEDCEAVVFCV